MSSERSIPHIRNIFGLSHQQQHQHSSDFHTNTEVVTNDNYLNRNVAHTSAQRHQKVDDLDVHTLQSTRKKRENHKTLTPGDVKTLERHLSMKKTIRKKIMRDLQQAFVDDPNEFKVDNTNSEHLRSELNAEALRFGEHPTKKSDKFLVMLRGDQQQQHRSGGYEYPSNAQQREYDYDSNPTTDAVLQPPRNEKVSFWKRITMKNKNKR